MLRKTLFLTVAAILVALATSSKAQAWFAYHYGGYRGLGGYGYGGVGFHYGGFGGYGYHYGGYYRGFGGYGGGYHYGYVRRW